MARGNGSNSGTSGVHAPGHDGDGTVIGAIEPIEIQEEMERSFLETCVTA